MPRRAQFRGEFIYHVMNRAAKRARLFHCDTDYIAVENLLTRAKAHTNMRLLTYCVMPNHWHLILWPANAHQMSQFMRRFTGTHAQQWQRARSVTGSGAVYQGRYRAIPIQTGRYFYNACRYVERNPLRAGLVSRAEDWLWSSLWRRLHKPDDPLLEPWPVPCPTDWVDTLNTANDGADELRNAIAKGVPLGDREWVTAAAARPTSGIRGRPRKASSKNDTRPRFT
jgi:putative transposase